MTQPTVPEPAARLANRISSMATYWEQHLPEVIRTPAVVSALRTAVEDFLPPASNADATTSPASTSVTPAAAANTLLDAAGKPISVGDTVGGTTSGRYQATIMGPIVSLGTGRVRIRVTTGPGHHGMRPDDGDLVWISASRVFLITPAADTNRTTNSPALTEIITEAHTAGRACGLREAASHARGRSVDTWGRACSPSTILCTVSDELFTRAAAAQAAR